MQPLTWVPAPSPVQLNNDRRFVIVPIVALLTGALTFSTALLRLPDREVLNSLFSAGPVHVGGKDTPELTSPAWALLFYIVRSPRHHRARLAADKRTTCVSLKPPSERQVLPDHTERHPAHLQRALYPRICGRGRAGPPLWRRPGHRIQRHSAGGCEAAAFPTAARMRS